MVQPGAGALAEGQLWSAVSKSPDAAEGVPVWGGGVGSAVCKEAAWWKAHQIWGAQVGEVGVGLDRCGRGPR